MKASIRLFKGLPVKSKRLKARTYKVSDLDLLANTIKMGFVFAPEIACNYTNYVELIEMVQDIYGMTAEKLNASFHKSWLKVKDTPMEQLVVEQLAHYLTTYGVESDYPAEYVVEKGAQWGVDNLGKKILELEDFDVDKSIDSGYIYIPKEKLNIPGLEIDNIKLVVIQGYTKKELKEKLMNLLNMGIALAEDTIKDVIDIALFVGVDEQDLATIRNKEIKATMYSYLNLIPENPVEFLRFIIYKITGNTLLIKSPGLIAAVKEKKDIHIVNLLEQYKRQYGFEKLAEIFYRFKPLWLALRTNRQLKTIVNRIGRLAKKYHKPMPIDYLNSITTKLKKGLGVYDFILENELNKVNTFRKIRLAYALKYRTKDVDSILYRIRNGKGYATDFNFDNKEGAKQVLDIVLNSIVEDISKNVKGKKIYIPENITYTLPATEKQFTGNFPSGTYVTIPRDMVFGVYWENVKGNRIDLDLSVISKSTKIGWDASYRSDEGDILFSGDLTDAQKGATELFYVRKQEDDALILFVNYYNFDENIEVPFKIVIAEEKISNFGKNYMVNPNNVAVVCHSNIKQQQKILGLIITNPNENRFYFAETHIGCSITSYNANFTEHSRKYLFNFYGNTIKLNDILEMAGAEITSDKKDYDISLAPEDLEKDTILGLLK